MKVMISKKNKTLIVKYGYISLGFTKCQKMTYRDEPAVKLHVSVF